MPRRLRPRDLRFDDRDRSLLVAGPGTTRRRWRAAVAGALVAGLALTGCTDGGPGELLGGGEGTASTGVVRVEPADRKEPPSVSGPRLDGEGTLDLADLRGDVVVLNIWGSWCGPCRAEAPALERTAKAFEDDGVRFVGLDTKDSDAGARAFVRNVGMSYPSIVDPDGEIQLSLRDHVPPTSVPSTIVLDRLGRVAVTVVGPVTQKSLTDVLQPVVDEQVRVRGTAVDGTEVDTADHDGVTLVTVFGSWSAPSRSHVTAVAAGAGDAEVVGVAVRDERFAARRFLRQHELDLPALLDADGRLSERLARAAGGEDSDVPATYVLAPGGTVTDVLAGDVDADRVRAAVAAAEGAEG